MRKYYIYEKQKTERKIRIKYIIMVFFLLASVQDVYKRQDIVQYDFDDTVIRDILAIAKHEQQHVYKVRDDYEKEIDHMKKNIEDIREESKKSAQIYEREITKKDEERRNCIETYEQEIAKKDEERRTCIETYEKEIARREEERNKLIEELHEK